MSVRKSVGWSHFPISKWMAILSASLTPNKARWHCGGWHGGRHGGGQGGWHGGGHGGFSTWSLPSLHISFAFVNPSPHHLLWIYHPPSFLSRVAERTNGGPAHQYDLTIHPVIKILPWNICVRPWTIISSMWSTLPTEFVALHTYRPPSLYVT